MLKLAVRWAAEFLYRQGDLHARLDGTVSAEEGIRTHQRLQQSRPAGYTAEVPLSAQFAYAGLRLQLGGRLDGAQRNGTTVLVEEIKTTRADPERVYRQHGPEHLAQARLYGALLLLGDPDIQCVQTRISYCHPDTLHCRSFDASQQRRELLAELRQTLTELGAWFSAQQAHRARRDAYLSTLAFPYDGFRPHQRALAGRVYQRLRAGEHLLLEAPTGSGKTSGVLFPALRVQGERGCDRIFYLTSRSTGAGAAWDSLMRHDPDGQQLRAIRIVAKERACPVAGMPCGPEQCAYARGYFARLPAARAALLSTPRMTETRVQQVAEAHQVCPFELSLDTAEWSDVIIADYNYLLDPVVRLQRFSDGRDSLVLVDEAHQLEGRVRDMLQIEFSRDLVRAALQEASPQPLPGRIRALDRHLLALRRPHSRRSDADLAYDESLTEKLQRLLEALAEVQLNLHEWPALRELVFLAARWTRICAVQQPSRMRLLLHPGIRPARMQLRLLCLDPAPYLADVWQRFPAHVRFSGTVSPLPLFQDMHGTPDGDQVRIASAYRPEQLGLWIVPDIPTYYRQRERTVDAAAQLVLALCGAAPGNYLVALPSFDYLQLLARALSACQDQLARQTMQILEQTRAMDEAARADFLQAFGAEEGTRIGLVVLGGVFGESVDFQDARLRGVICFGTGLPPPDRARQIRLAHLEAAGPVGRTRVFTQPAMTKIVQMAGRVLRDPGDRGIVCLVDPRFRDPEYQQFFPAHWRPAVLSAKALGAAARAFWATPDNGRAAADGQC